MKNTITMEKLKDITGGTGEEEIEILLEAYCPRCRQPRHFRVLDGGFVECKGCGTLLRDKVVLQLLKAYRMGQLP